MLAALFSHPGPGLPVNLWQRCAVKWLQFLVRRLYDVPWNSCETSCMIASISFWGDNVKPWRISCLKVPPGGRVLGFVQYTPVTPLLSCPPYAYSLPLITTPLCKSDVPMAQRNEENLPGWSMLDLNSKNAGD